MLLSRIYYILAIGLLCFAESRQITNNVAEDDFIRTLLGGAEYEIIDIEDPRIHKRDVSGKIQMQIKSFGEIIKLYLNPVESVLVGENTPVLEIVRNANVVPGKKKVGDYKIRLYEDLVLAASLTITKGKHGQNEVSGVIGNKGLQIRPLPTTSKQFQRPRRSLDNSTESNLRNHHIVYKTPHLHNIFPKLNSSIGGTTRMKRSVPKTIIYPEILILVDYSLFKEFQSITDALAYFLPFWNAVDLKYRTLDKPKIRLNIAGLIFAKDKYALEYLHHSKNDADNLVCTVALTDEREWIWRNRRKFPAFDATVTMTQDILCDPHVEADMPIEEVDGTEGISYPLSACDVADAHAIIQDNKGYKAIHTVAHELGHIFGAYHDGLSEHPNCPQEYGYIMSPRTSLSPNGSDWSICSLSDFDKFLNDPELKCMDNKPNIGTPLRKFLPGRLMTADKQCQQIYGPRSKARYTKSSEEVCEVLLCSVDKATGKGGATLSLTQAAAGTVCGFKKICLHSRCIDESLIMA